MDKTRNKILVADDDRDILDGIVGVLKEDFKGFDILAANCGNKAVELFREHRDSIAAVLTDNTMPPGPGGLKFCEIIRTESEGTIPVLIVAAIGKETPVFRRSAIAAGAADFIPKPIDLSKLFDTLHGLMKKQ